MGAATAEALPYVKRIVNDKRKWLWFQNPALIPFSGEEFVGIRWLHSNIRSRPPVDTIHFRCEILQPEDLFAQAKVFFYHYLLLLPSLDYGKAFVLTIRLRC